MQPLKFMFVQINATPKSVRPPEDAIDFLLACHERTRKFLDIAGRLSTVEKAYLIEIADAAAGLDRFFESAFALHRVDEELSLLPHLRRLEVPNEVSIALDVLEWEHEELDPLVEQLCVLFRALENAPSTLREHQPAMQRLLDEVRPKLLSHLEMEEQVVLPWAKTALSSEELAEMLAQFRHRRGA